MEKIIHEIKAVRTIEYEKIEDGIVYYRDIRPDGEIIEGITFKENLDVSDFEPIEYRFNIHPKCDHNDGIILLLHKNDIEEWSKSITDVNSLYIKSKLNLKNFLSGKNEDIVPVYLSTYSNDLYDMDKRVYPKAVFMEYMTGINDRDYDLDKLREYLLGCPRVVDISDIVEIPWYNQMDGQKYQITFIFVPTREEYKKFYSEGTFERIDNVIELLGIDRFKRKDSRWE